METLIIKHRRKNSRGVVTIDVYTQKEYTERLTERINIAFAIVWATIVVSCVLLSIF